jgi:hypothetical protein
MYDILFKKKPIGKRISHEFVEKFSDPKTIRLDVYTTTVIIGLFYCDRLVMSRLCPYNCCICQGKIAQMTNLSDARNPEAMLTYQAKAAAAEVADEQQYIRAFAKPIPAPDQNIFEVYSTLI